MRGGWFFRLALNHCRPCDNPPHWFGLSLQKFNFFASAL